MILLNLSQLKACTCAARKMLFVILTFAWIGETVEVIDKHIISHLIQKKINSCPEDVVHAALRGP